MIGAITTLVECLSDEQVKSLLVKAIRLLEARGLATVEDARTLEMLGEEGDMAIQLSFDGQHNQDVDPLVNLLGTIRKVEAHGTLWFSAVEFSAAVRGGVSAPRQYWYDIKRKIEAEDKRSIELSDNFLRLKLEAQDGKQRETDMINEQGCYRVMMTVPGKFAGRIRRWMAEQLQEYRQAKASIPVTPPASSDYVEAPEIAALEYIIGYMRRVDMDNQTIKRDNRDLKQRVSALEQAKQAPALPAPTAPLPLKSVRSALSELVRSKSIAQDVHYSFLWNKLYHELKYREHFDALTRAENSDRKPIDLVEEAGLLPALYAIACEVL